MLPFISNSASEPRAAADVTSSLSMLDAPLLRRGSPPDFSTLRCDSLCLLFWDRFGPCVVVRGLSKDRPVTCWPCNPVSHADAVWIFLQSCLFPCCNLVTHPWWSIVGKLRADTRQRMHLIRVGWNKINKQRDTTTTITTTTGGGSFYFHTEFHHLWQSWLIRPLLARLRPGH